MDGIALREMYGLGQGQSHGWASVRKQSYGERQHERWQA
jgi:hypothetical protein